MFAITGKTSTVKAEVPRVEGDEMLWGTYGISGKEPLKLKKLRDCDTDHLQAILRTQSHVHGCNRNYGKVIANILKARGAEVPSYSHEAYLEFVRRVSA